MPMFDMQQFMNSAHEGVNSTEYIPIPEGTFEAILKKIEMVPWQSKTDADLSGYRFAITWEILDEDVRQELDRKIVTINQQIMLDFTEDGQLDMGKGKNVNLGRLREALNMNQGSFIPKSMEGQVARVQIKQSIWEDKPVSNVSAVLPLSE